jgi:uncharacterized protein (TIGR00369 family)
MSKITLSVLDYLRKLVSGTISDGESTFMRYPTAISKTLKMSIADIGEGKATVAIDADASVHGNQQGTVHGGLLAELADAAIGTAHSTLMNEGESFTSIELKINFYRPVSNEQLKAVAFPIQSGKTITHYQCDIIRPDGKVVARATSVVMTLRGDKAAGR